jgi:predicted HTH transcriptional regulator
MLGFEVNNQLFAENSWYFRNALVRANYTNYGRNIHTEFKYLNYFFENLLLKQDHELKNRNLKIYANSNQMENTKFSEVLELIKKDKKITAIILSKKLNKGIATIKRELKRLKDDGYISRVGSDKTGS